MVTHIRQLFSNKVVVVTGSAHGIGRAIALRFGGESGQVIMNDINAQASAVLFTAESGSPSWVSKAP